MTQRSHQHLILGLFAGALLAAGCGSSGNHASTRASAAGGSSARPTARTGMSPTSSPATSSGTSPAALAGGSATGTTVSGTSTHPQATRVPAVHGGQSAAAVFAAAYAEFLDGRRVAATLPFATDAARAQALAGGPIPRAGRRGRLRVVGLRAAQGPAGGWVLIARDRAHTFYASISVANGALVVGVQPPDYVQVFARPAPPPRQPAGSRVPEQTARAFLTGYLAWQYGQGTVQAIRDLTVALRASLAANPPRVPPTIRALHPQVKALAMQRSTGGWRALPVIFDGQQTYELVLAVRPAGGGWLVSAVGLPK